MERIDYHLALDMAKELSMVENNEQGRAARRYFIACERQALAVAQPTPYTVQPSDTLNEPQQIALRAMLESNVKRLPHAQQAGAMIKGWSKLKAHFGVPYRQIPAGEFEEALSIIARHVSEWELVDEAPKASTLNETVAHLVKQTNSADRMQAILGASLDAGARVQQVVAQGMLTGGGEDWSYQRWVLAFAHDAQAGAVPYLRQMEQGAFVSTWPRLADSIRSGECLRSTPELLDMANACLAELARRNGNPAVIAIARMPAEVRALFDQHMARLCADAHTHIGAWAVKALASRCNLDYAADLQSRAQGQLSDLHFEDWLTQGASAQARALLNLFDVAKGIAGEASERYAKQLAMTLQKQ